MSTSMYRGTNVVELKDRDFTQDDEPALQSTDKAPGLIMFYSKTCPFCTGKRDDYISLADQLGDSGFSILAVDTRDPASRSISERLVQGVPTFYEVDKAGLLKPYEEPFDRDAVVVLATKVTGSSVPSDEEEELVEDEPEQNEEALEDEEAVEVDSLSKPSSVTVKSFPSGKSVNISTEPTEEEFPSEETVVEEEEIVGEFPMEAEQMGSGIRDSGKIRAGSGKRQTKATARSALKRLTLKELQKLAREFKRPVVSVKASQIEKLLL
jgi:thiol-disulfide isomerase/thioredoxin